MRFVETLHSELRGLVAEEREALVFFLHKLDEFDRADGYLAFAKGSLWAYLVEVLGLRESSAGRRIAAMKLLRRFPQLDPPLADGRLCITTLGLIAPLMTPENVDDIVRQGSNLTKRQTEELVARLQPRTPPREGIRKLPSSPPPPLSVEVGSQPSFSLGPAREEGQKESTPAPAPGPALSRSRPPVRIEPCSAEEASMRVTIDQAIRDRLEKARSIASHEIPDGDLRQILFLAFGDFIEKREKRKGLAKPEHPRKPTPPRPPTPGKRAPISAETARIVYERDGYCCAFVGLDGKRCGSTWQLELHHREPAPITGSSRPEDLEVRCRPHNVYEAKLPPVGAHSQSG